MSIFSSTYIYCSYLIFDRYHCKIYSGHRNVKNIGGDYVVGLIYPLEIGLINVHAYITKVGGDQSPTSPYIPTALLILLMQLATITAFDYRCLFYETTCMKFFWKMHINFIGTKTKAELLQLKPHPFICTRNYINKKVGNRKN